MFILKYLTKFRLILYVGAIVCVIMLSTNPYWYDVLIGDSGVAIEENQTAPDWGLRETNMEEIRVSEIYPNCGLKVACPENTFAVHVYTGRNKDDEPKVCIQGKYIAGGGRGLNFAVIEPRYLQLVGMHNFDLYSHNSTSLEMWLEYGLNDDDIVIAFTFDEASKELSKKARHLLYKMGSGRIQDLRYRSQWYMITQRRQEGFTPYEMLTYALNDRWGEVIDERLCVPKTIVKLPISADPFPRKNTAREQFCAGHPELTCDHFCEAWARHEPLTPSLLTNRSLIGNPVFSTPILVIAGPTLSSLALTLETLVYQPGVHVATVFVVLNETQTEAASMAQIFGARTLFVNSTGQFSKMKYGLDYVQTFLPKKKYAIVIEEGLILAPDYLYYMAQLVPILEKDETLLGISAWNPYGYKTSSGSPSAVYRVEDFPGLGFLLRMEIYAKLMKRNCCPSKSYLGWPQILSRVKNGNILIPDLSRVLKRPKDYLGRPKDDEYTVFTLPRTTCTDINAHIDRPHDLTESRYFLQIASLIDSSITIHLTTEDLKLCDENANIAMKVMLSELKNKIFALHYTEDSPSHGRLRAYLKCFDVFLPERARPQTTYKKLIRFSIQNNTVLLIESSSPFAKRKNRI